MSKQDPYSADALIVEVVRGEIVESSHQVSLAMVDVHGHLLLAFGDKENPIYMRSSAKPFQALPWVEAGLSDTLKISSQELAILCASHSGTDQHVEVVRDVLGRIGLTEASLQCGTHTPFDRSTARSLLNQGKSPSPFRHNCSGKHTGMLLYSHSLKAKAEHYLQRSGLVQRKILKAFSEMVGVPEQEIEVGIDGCSAPNFAVPLPAAALGYARLMDPSDLGEQRAQACDRIVQAMVSHPDMVAGSGRFDTQLMQVVEGRLLAKAGAEGYQAVGIPSGQLAKETSAGIALKVHDGDSGKRARSLITVAILSSLGLVTIDERAKLSAFDERPLLNFSKLTVGEIRLAEESKTRLQEAHERI